MLSDEQREALRLVGCSRHLADTESFICRPCADAETALVERILAARAEVAEQIAVAIEAAESPNSRNQDWLSGRAGGLTDAAAIARGQ